ncbi:methyl-accepting chemotaxis protein [Photobacterium sp.]|uniref:methyl-accepting chemotaxis protein n=1 Tax=Photobacterium sp. TaxID=660 RepID=UPI00299E522C|nr:methyl-accepting chemotaxis protein [Photobacterium sp.]MDX1304105.1 methyl-accepting chemotaxis protein [Photobacterium sp.]
MKIKHKLLGLTVISVTALLLILEMSWLANERVMAMNHTAVSASELEVTLLNLRRNEKDFLLRMDSKYQPKFQANYTRFQAQLADMSGDLAEASIAISGLQALPGAMERYHDGMITLIKGYQKIGLSHNEGLHRPFFSRADQLLGIADKQNLDTLEIYSLTLTAKLFTLTKDANYLNEYRADYEKNGLLLEQDFGDIFVDFHRTFEQIVAQHELIGMNHNDGLRGEIRALSHQVEKVFADVQQQLAEEIAADSKLTKQLIIIAVVIIIIALLMLSWLISRSIQRRVQGLSDLMATIAHSHDLTLIADESGDDELAQMARNFNHLLSSLRQLVGNVQGAITELGVASEQLQRRSKESEMAMNQQQAETDSVATAITEMGMTIREIASNTETAAANADRSHHGAMEGLSEVSATKERIRSLSGDLSQTSDEVASLSNLSENIGSVLDVIKAIAEQTNLLALNAAIEAARAGEQGRGFAVVADEVRSLALRTRQSTEEITTIIASLQEQTDQVVVHIGRCREQGDLSVTQADSAEVRINQIMTDMQLIMDTSTQIAAAVEQQSLVSDEIGQNVTSIRDITNTNSDVAHENAQAAYAVADQAKSLDEAIAEYRV